ncbi:MAG: putative methyltransferase domain protein [Streblomastix strix]|uniref:Putative methyltransferase domain protein n=1 Tax=Streblomastix strix TaxID=222440 RepID=A0A5J4U7Y8_9EUKA|nr:MAG: putative methyltransferase domain protein [Streblomastix strix]
MAEYGSTDFWNRRYANVFQRFDWLLTYQFDLKPILHQFLESNSLILDIGCGSSRLDEELYDDGFKNISAIDKCPAVIYNMKTVNNLRPEINWFVMDATEMTFPSESFDIFIDKATSDAIFCSRGSFINIRKMLLCISRVLRRGGIYIVISHRPPDKREKFFSNLQKYGWSFSWETVASKRANDSLNGILVNLPENFYIYYMNNNRLNQCAMSVERCSLLKNYRNTPAIFALKHK